jgi:GT2 family glycosyltransferase
MSPSAIAPLSSVTIIVVTYNSAHCLAALHPLLQHGPHIIVSDNASGDDTAAQAQALWPQATVLAHERNLGFGAANNRALAQVQTPFALLLNPDCEISVAQLQQLLAEADQFPEAAMLAPQLVDAHGQPEVNYRWPSTHWVSKGPAASGPASVGFVCGAAMLLRMSACRPTGFFDETFFLYYEDDDLCLRFFQARLPMVIVPQVQALHRSRGSVKGKSPWRSEYWRGYHHAQSKLTFLAKHFGVSQATRRRHRLIVLTALALCIRVLLPSPKHIARMVGRFRGLIKYQNPFL